MSDSIAVEFRGHFAKKNAWSPLWDSKRVMSVYYQIRKGCDVRKAMAMLHSCVHIGLAAPDKKVLETLELQVSGSVRDLSLEDPKIDVYFTYTTKRWDRDNYWTTICDILCRYKVLKGDSIAALNSKIVLHPAVRGDYDGCRVVLHPRAMASENLFDDLPEADDAPPWEE